jgi:ribosome-associated protein
MAQPLPDPSDQAPETPETPEPRARRTRTRRLARALGTNVKQEPDPLDIAREVVRLASDKGAADILLMDIRKMSIIADYFVICSGDNERQIRAINRGISEGIDEQWGLDPLNHRPTVAQEQAGWVVLDYGSVIVHIFSPQMREFYRLERLWSEAATLLRMQ